MTADVPAPIADLAGEPKRFCRKCLLRDMEDTGGVDLEKYLSALKGSDKADTALYEERLLICRSCDRLTEATCLACGCYVEFRAAMKMSRCPKKKW